MKTKVLAILLCSALSVCAFSGCEDAKAEPEESSISTVALEEGVFDIDAVRNNISIKGHKFIVPQKLSQLESGLKYKFVGEEFDDGLYETEISDDEGLILRTIVRNAHDKDKNAELYNISVGDSDSDIAGIIPLVSTEDDVLKQFGKPDHSEEVETDTETKLYRYGEFTDKNSYSHIGNLMTVSFNNSGIVQQIVVSYSELS